MNNPLHHVQVSILDTLRHTKTARFSDLMHRTDMQSDAFKFHLQKLATLGYVEKTNQGDYRLTATGKEFANNLDKAELAVQRQPKLSAMLLVSRQQNDETQYLFQQRLRSPYYGYWTCIGGPIQWGEDAEATARRELEKQTGLSATCITRCFLRQKDYETTNHRLLEDKLFVVLEATDAVGELSNAWHGGRNQWMTLADFEKQPEHFSTVSTAIKMLRTNTNYTSRDTYYSPQDY